MCYSVIVSEQDNVLTEDLLDDGGHEEGDGDHGGGQEQEHQRGARHHQVGGAVRGLLQQTLSTQSWLRGESSEGVIEILRNTKLGEGTYPTRAISFWKSPLTFHFYT